MTENDQLEFRLGLDAITSYKRLSYSPWHAIAEFVDNSTQNLANFESELKTAFERESKSLRVDVAYDRDQDLIRVSDNAMGMDREELDRAMMVGARPANTDGRSKYGLGMKTAACWLGNQWSVRTKKLGSTVELEVEVDVERVAGGDQLLPTRISEGQDPDQHYTIIEIRDLNRRLHGRTLGKIKEFLRSMYRQDLREESLDLRWQGERLDWEFPDDLFLRARDKSLYKKSFNFEIEGDDDGTKVVKGWVGILDRGSRAKAGFSMLHAGRVVKGWPESWRPESIYGQYQGSNDLINQRVVGEIELDDFTVSHTKDDILWFGTEQEQVETKLREAAADYVDIAKRRRKGTEAEGGPSDQEVQVAVEELESELSSSELADLINIEDVPPKAAVTESLQPLLDDARRADPDFKAAVGNWEVRGFLDGDLSPNDPYVATDSTRSDLVLVIVNVRHPHFRQLEGASGVLNYLRHCVYDAIAEWQARKQDTEIDSQTVKILKDRLLRVAMDIEMREPHVVAQDGAGD